MIPSEVNENKHLGRNVKRIREMLGVKQDALAFELGLSQQAVSQLEQREVLDTDMLERIAGVLKVPVDAINNFDEEKAIFIIQNNYEGANSGSGTIGNKVDYQGCTFNPIEKIVELYESLLKSEKEKVELLLRMLNNK